MGSKRVPAGTSDSMLILVFKKGGRDGQHPPNLGPEPLLSEARPSSKQLSLHAGPAPGLQARRVRLASGTASVTNGPIQQLTSRSKAHEERPRTSAALEAACPCIQSSGLHRSRRPGITQAASRNGCRFPQLRCGPSVCAEQTVLNPPKALVPGGKQGRPPVSSGLVQLPACAVAAGLSAGNLEICRESRAPP